MNETKKATEKNQKLAEKEEKMKILEIKPRSQLKTELHILLGIFNDNWQVKVQLDNGQTKTVSIKFKKWNPTKRDCERFITYVKNKVFYGKQYSYDVDKILEKRQGEETRKKQPEWITNLIGTKILAEKEKQE